MFQEKRRATVGKRRKYSDLMKEYEKEIMVGGIEDVIWGFYQMLRRYAIIFIQLY